MHGLLDRRSGIRKRWPSRRGAVAAELALLVFFVYVPLVIGALYIAWLAVGRQRVHETNHYALLGEGDQSEQLAERGEMTHTFFPEFTGQVEVHESEGDDPDVPGDDELRRLWQEFTKPIYFRNVSAHGSFHLVGNRVVYRETVHVNEGFRIRREGQCVEKWNLLADNIPENVTDFLQEYLIRRKAHAAYRHSWVHDDTDVVAGGGGVAGWTLQVPSNPTQDIWTPETAIRGEKRREARDQNPPGASLRQRISTPLHFPDAEPSDDFWHPCEGPSQEGPSE